MPEPITSDVAGQAVTHLTRLQELVQEQGLLARLLTQGARLPCLRVINPNAATLAEVVSAAPLEEQWWFWWSWAEPITPVGDIATAAERIRHVLATAAPDHPAPICEPTPRRRPTAHVPDGGGGALLGHARPGGATVPIA